MQRLFPAERAVLILFQLTLNILAVFSRCVILAFAFTALKRDYINGCLFLASHTVLLNCYQSTLTT